MKEIDEATRDLELLRKDGECIQPNKSLKTALAALRTMKIIKDWNGPKSIPKEYLLDKYISYIDNPK